MRALLRESDVEALLSPEDAVEAVEECFARIARGSVENQPRARLGLTEGRLNVMAAADLDLGVAGLKSYASFDDGTRFVVVLFAADRSEVLAIIEADRLGQRRTGAASAVAARHLARARRAATSPQISRRSAICRFWKEIARTRALLRRQWQRHVCGSRRGRAGAAALTVPRLSGHSGQDTQAYKSADEIAAERARDPLQKLRERWCRRS